MTMLRQFLMAPSLARLIQRERGGEHVVEGYFPDRPHHSIYVQVGEDRSSLILSSHGIEGSPEEGTGITTSQAQALLAVASGQVAYVRTSLLLGSHQIHLQQVTEPGPLCLLSVEVSREAEEFQPLSWFGPEVSGERAYRRRRIALDGLPAAPEVELTEGALNSVLDLLENGFTAWPLRDQAAASEEPGARLPAAAGPSEPAPAGDDDQDIDDLGIENDVIRELARSLRPQRRCHQTSQSWFIPVTGPLCLRVAPGIRSAGSCWHQGWISPTCTGFDLPEELEQAFAGYDVSASQIVLAPPAVALDKNRAHLRRGDPRGA